MNLLDPSALLAQDPEIFQAIANEERRQKDNLELIASENYASAAVRDALGCVM
ncbi:MAG: serine hydroxymethyltransferase, partial [Candidatus Eremiobacteraeota bacterium]|nr:serine hydroxymethyltransferase [Candidatus Eremiobacteraeota bacterium]